MRIIILIGRAILNLIYCFHKLLPIRGKVTIISRQSDEPTLDIRLLNEELEKHPDLEVKVLCRTLGNGAAGKIRYLFHLLGPQMHALATSRAVVLDSYCIAASILRHRKALKIIQMWHAMGGFKKFGYSILDQEEGSKRWLAEAMRMHKNYNYILASSEESARFFKEAFHYGRESFKILPLPRTDLLRDRHYMERKREEIYADYPQLKEKETILYAPTFRKGTENTQGIQALIESVDYDRYHLLVALHPLMKQNRDIGKAIAADPYTTLELLSVCQYFITDYSAVIYEAALAGKPIFLYAYDLEAYTEKRGFYIDYDKDLPGKPYSDPRTLLNAIEEHRYDMRDSRAFADRYVINKERVTRELAEFICSLTG